MVYHVPLIDHCAIFVDFIMNKIFPAVVVHVESVLHLRRSRRASHAVFCGEIGRESERKSDQQNWRSNSQERNQIVCWERCLLHLKTSWKLVLISKKLFNLLESSIEILLKVIKPLLRQNHLLPLQKLHRQLGKASLDLYECLKTYYGNTLELWTVCYSDSLSIYE